ncbi:glutathione peroxidase [Eggerthellaceae bacterium zg-997]|nr:glutathione peroxidase [Eggerthellaceae bacterium zg-997]
MGVYDFQAKNRDGSVANLSDYQGKVLLVVNTATGCGFTPQYEQLEAMYRDLRDRGFEILDFPCNQFANQAPGDDEQIHEFCTVKFGADFPQFSKVEVNGDDAHPLFPYLAQQKPFQGFTGMKKLVLNQVSKAVEKEFGDKAHIRWNFTKFLIDREGNVIERFEPTVRMDEVRQAVEAQL